MVCCTNGHGLFMLFDPLILYCLSFDNKIQIGIVIFFSP